MATPDRNALYSPGPAVKVPLPVNMTVRRGRMIGIHFEIVSPIRTTGIPAATTIAAELPSSQVSEPAGATVTELTVVSVRTKTKLCANPTLATAGKVIATFPDVAFTTMTPASAAVRVAFAAIAVRCAPAIVSIA